MVRGSVMVGGAEMEPTKEYTLATSAFLATGKDGYGVFTETREVRILAHCCACHNLLFPLSLLLPLSLVLSSALSL